MSADRVLRPPTRRLSGSGEPTEVFSPLRGRMNFVIRMLLLALALAPVSSWAQKGSTPPPQSVSGSGSRPAAARPSSGAVHSGRRPATIGPPGWCRGGNCNGNRGEGGYWPGYYPGYGPYGGLDPYWELGGPAESEPSSPPQPQVIMVREPPQQQNPASAPSISPKMIEVPPQKTAQGKQVAPSAPVPPAVFILTNGQRIEAQRYLLTEGMLQVQRGREQQTIPLNELNRQATIAANQARGIDLQIPENKYQLTLGF